MKKILFFIGVKYANGKMTIWSQPADTFDEAIDSVLDKYEGITEVYRMPENIWVSVDTIRIEK